MARPGEWVEVPQGVAVKEFAKQLREEEKDPYGKQTKGNDNKVVGEADPYGYQRQQPGAKLDEGKICVTRGALHYFPRALREVARLSTIGARKYSWRGWEAVPDGINRYADALGRHELAIEGDYTRRDPDSGVLEAVAVAWNALARLELILREQDK